MSFGQKVDFWLRNGFLVCIYYTLFRIFSWGWVLVGVFWYEALKSMHCLFEVWGINDVKKKSPNISLCVKISCTAIKVTKCTAADTSKFLLFNRGQVYNTKRNLKSGKYRNHGNLLTEV